MIEPISVRNKHAALTRKQVSTRCVYIICLAVVITLTAATLISVIVYFTVHATNNNKSTQTHDRIHKNSSFVESPIISCNTNFSAMYENSCKLCSFICLYAALSKQSSYYLSVRSSNSAAKSRRLLTNHKWIWRRATLFSLGNFIIFLATWFFHTAVTIHIN